MGESWDEDKVMANNFWWEAMAYIGILYRIRILETHKQPLNVTIPFILIPAIEKARNLNVNRRN
jgi:hypothetical protein